MEIKVPTRGKGAKDLTREVRIVDRVEGSHLRKVRVSLNPKPNTRWWCAGG